MWSIIDFCIIVLCLILLFSETEETGEKIEGGFGDMMSKKGYIGNIWRPILALFVFIYYYSKITKISLYTILCYYLIGVLGYYLWHVRAHQKTSMMYKTHMKHHKEDYPIDDFYGDKSKANIKLFGNQNNPPTFLQLLNPTKSMSLHIEHDGWLYLIIICILLFGKYIFKTNNYTLIYIFIGYIIIACVGSSLHISYHIRNFEFQKYAWYRELRMLHYFHHSSNKNYTMVNILIDIMFNTLIFN